MTNLEQIIRDATAKTTVHTLSAATEKWAEEMAREMLKDPTVKAEFIALIRKAFADTLASMNQQAPTP